MRSLLLFLAFTYVLIVPLPALAQTSQGSSSGDQYDPNVPGDGTADGAVHAALVASGALQTPSEVAQATRGSSVSADESSSVPPSEGDAAFAEEGGAASSTESASAAEEGGATSSTESASAAEAQGESANSSGFEKLPDTGGPSPLWLFGAPLICIGGIIARRILLA